MGWEDLTNNGDRVSPHFQTNVQKCYPLRRIFESLLSDWNYMRLKAVQNGYVGYLVVFRKSAYNLETLYFNWQEFHRQGDSNTVNQHKLPVPVTARYLRFNPTQRHAWNCLRVEVYETERELQAYDLKIYRIYFLRLSQINDLNFWRVEVISDLQKETSSETATLTQQKHM